MFKGKRAVVTGAAGGIGRELVHALLAKGAEVVATDLDPAGLEDLTEQASRYGMPLETRNLDVTSRDAFDDFIATIRLDKPVEYWFNNAGIAKIEGFLTSEPESFDKVMAVNFEGVVNGTRSALVLMQERGIGAIVNVASVAGHVAPPFMTSYAASKHAVVGFTRSLQTELKLHQSAVRVVLASPGFVNTPIIGRGDSHGFPEWLAWMLSDARSVARSILRGLEKGQDEIFPTLNGKFILGLQQIAPRFTRGTSKILLAKSFRDFLLNRYDVPVSSNLQRKGK